MKNNEMMKKIENGETVIGMLCHMIIGLWYQSCECTLSWTSDDEEEYTEVMEKYWMETSDEAEHPLTILTYSLFLKFWHPLRTSSGNPTPG